MSNIQEFSFDHAVYKIVADGSQFYLKVDYKNNEFKLEGDIPKNTKKVKLLATDMLKRKHGVNFAYKLK